MGQRRWTAYADNFTQRAQSMFTFHWCPTLRGWRRSPSPAKPHRGATGRILSYRHSVWYLL